MSAGYKFMAIPSAFSAAHVSYRVPYTDYSSAPITITKKEYLRLKKQRKQRKQSRKRNRS